MNVSKRVLAAALSWLTLAGGQELVGA